MTDTANIAPQAPLTLLLIDDEEIVLNATKAYLTGCFSYQVDTAISGHLGLMMIREKHYDAIIADYEMEEMSGIELLKILRGQGNDTPFIVFTGRGREEVVIAAFENRADGYIQKGGEVRSQYAELANKVENIVRKRQAEQAHKKSEEEYLNLYEKAPDAYLSLDERWVISRCNVKAEELTGLSRNSLIGSSFFDIFADIYEGKGRAIELFGQFVKGVSISDEELVIEGSDKIIRWVTLSINVTWDESGHICLIRSILHDITERKKTEQQLLTTQHLLKDAHRLAHIGIWEWDSQKDSISWSEELCKIIGWDPDTPPPIFSELSQYYHPESWRRLQAAVTNSLVTGEPYDLELQFAHADGRFIWIHAFGEPVYTTKGNLRGLHGTIQDISDRKQYEEKIKLHATRLEALLKLNHFADLSPDTIFQYAMNASLAITNSKYSFIGVVDPSEQIMIIHAWSDETIKTCEILEKQIEFPLESAGIWGEVVRKRAVQFINNYDTYPPAKKGFPDGHIPITRFLCVPICDGNRVVVVIGVANKASDYLEDDVQALTAFGNEIWRILEQKRINDSLQESEEKYRLIADNTADHIWIYDMDLNLTYSSPSVTRMKGFTVEETLSLSLNEIMTPESVESVIRRFEEEVVLELSGTADPHRMVTFETEEYCKDGSTILVENTAKLLRSPKGEPMGILGISRDITERKKAEEALFQSQQQLEDIINFLPDATFVVDKAGTIIAWNKAIEKMTGFLASEMIGKANYEYALPFYQERRPILIDLAMQFDPEVADKYREFQRVKQKVISESIIANFKGEEVTLWSIAAPLFDKSGWLIGAVESIRDVTERKRTEDALREALETLNTVMDSIDALIYVSDMKTYEILFINQYGKRVWGDVIGKKCYESLQQNQTSPCSFCTNEILVDKEGEPAGVITREFQNTTSKRWYQCRDSAIRWIDGRIVRMEIATDITERRKGEQALTQANRQLTMLTGITRHDILNSVNAIQMLLELAKGKLDLSPAAKEFEYIETALSLIQSHIEFTRVYEDLGTHAPQWQNIHAIIRACAFQSTLNIIDTADDIEIYADPLLKKVFENLIENSIRHGRSVSTIAISSTLQGTDIQVSYEDDGGGIDPKEKRRIFERGFGKNTGLGLSFICEILSITGISILETGVYGIGARFVITVPEGVWRYQKGSEQAGRCS